MELIGQSVQHKTLGVGIIESSDGKYLSVRFGVGLKTFVYPAAFRDYLTVSDPALEKEIAEALAASDAARERVEARRREESRYLAKKGVVIPGNRIDEQQASDPYREEEEV